MLLGHFAKSNPVWEKIDGKNILVTFQGAHGVINPEWYQTQGNVPTWNYTVVHIRGEVQIFKDHPSLIKLLKTMANLYQLKDVATPKELLNGIVGFELKISEVDGKAKLGQTKTKPETENVINYLEKIGNLELAKSMKETL